MMSALAAAVLLAGTAPAETGATGLWKTPVDGGSTVRIDACGEAICGHAVSSPRLVAFPDQKDVLNHDPALRDRPIKGLLLLSSCIQSGRTDGATGGYTIREAGGTYRGAAELKSDGRLLLQGCIVVPLCQTQDLDKGQIAGGSPPRPPFQTGGEIAKSLSKGVAIKAKHFTAARDLVAARSG